MSYSPEAPKPQSERKGLPPPTYTSEVRGTESVSEPGAEPDEIVITNIFQKVI